MKHSPLSLNYSVLKCSGSLILTVAKKCAVNVVAVSEVAMENEVVVKSLMKSRGLYLSNQ